MGALVLTKRKGLKIGDYSLYSAKFVTGDRVPQPRYQTYAGAELMQIREVPFGTVPVGTDTRTPGYLGKRNTGSVRNIRPQGRR